MPILLHSEGPSPSLLGFLVHLCSVQQRALMALLSHWLVPTSPFGMPSPRPFSPKGVPCIALRQSSAGAGVWWSCGGCSIEAGRVLCHTTEVQCHVFCMTCLR